MGKESRITHRFLTWEVGVRSIEKPHTEICKEEMVSNDSPMMVFVHQVRSPKIGGMTNYIVKNWHLYLETPAFPFSIRAPG